MYTDLFRAIAHGKNDRKHPILNALLYVFCPLAAYWSRTGADIVIPDDIVWQAMTDFASGVGIKEALEAHGVDEPTNEKLKKYYAVVNEWRNRNHDLAPELSSMFPMQAHFAPAATFGNSDVYQYFGGQWRYLFEYVRVWSVLIYQWQDAIAPGARDDGDIEFTLQEVALSAPGVRKPAYFQVWAWEQKNGMSSRTHLGLLVNFPGVSKHPQIIRDKIQGIQDQLRFALVQHSARVGKEPWSSPPNVYALDRATGASTPFDVTVNTSDVLKMVSGLSEAARRGPHYPLGALQAPEKCGACGFRWQCYRNGNTVTDEAIKKVFEKKADFPLDDDDDDI